MAKNINLLDRAPQAVISGLNWVLAPFEDPTGLDRPRWMDSSRYQGVQDFSLQTANGVWGNIFRMGISYKYTDPMFATNWGESQGKLRYRSSYHVLYPDQLVKPQFDNWIKAHPMIEIIPRVIDLELQRAVPPVVIANQVWEMSERVADHDGVRPIIYSRYMLINQWLAPYWSDVMLNEHFYILAQYLWDRTREHPGEPNMPNGVEESRVIMQQTADKKATPTGEAESASIDWDRWEIGNTEQMQQWIADTWSGVPIDPNPTPEPELIARIQTLEDKVKTLEEWVVAHDGAEYIEVKVTDEKANATAIAGYNESGFPIFGVNVYQETGDPALHWKTGDKIKVWPVPIKADGGDYWYELYDVPMHGYDNLYTQKEGTQPV